MFLIGNRPGPRLGGLVLFLSVLMLACRGVSPAAQPTGYPPAVQAPASAPNPVVLALPQPESDEQSALVELYARVNPAVVNIVIYRPHHGQLVAFSQGSGFIYNPSGHIVTNAHVVHGADQVEVTFSDGTVAMAQIVGQDMHSDLAVVQADGIPAGVQPLSLGDMAMLAVGQTVVAIGNPFGLQGSLSRGVISALGRTIPSISQFSIPQAIQTDAAINPGNSGGPLLNLQGEVIGVNTQIENGGSSPGNSGVGFAIPISLVRRVVPDLIANGSHAWAWLGVNTNNLSPALVQAMSLPSQLGVYVESLVPGSPAEKAGLLAASNQVTLDERIVPVGGDVITAVDGQPIRRQDDLVAYLALQAVPGQAVTLSILRNRQPQTFRVVLEARPSALGLSNSH